MPCTLCHKIKSVFLTFRICHSKECSSVTFVPDLIIICTFHCLQFFEPCTCTRNWQVFIFQVAYSPFFEGAAHLIDFFLFARFGYSKLGCLTAFIGGVVIHVFNVTSDFYLWLCPNHRCYIYFLPINFADGEQFLLLQRHAKLHENNVVY